MPPLNCIKLFYLLRAKALNSSEAARIEKPFAIQSVLSFFALITINLLYRVDMLRGVRKNKRYISTSKTK